LGGGRGCGRAAAVIVLVAVLALSATPGCGRGGHGAETDPEKGADAAILNAALARELTLLDVYSRGRSYLRGPLRRSGRRLRAEQAEYVDDVTKAIRSLGGESEAEAEAVDLTGVTEQAGFLALVVRLETEAREFYVDKAAQLHTPAPRTLDAWLAAGHGEHLGTLASGGG
jgi:hypothetical protein